jgi:hypothetical protein
MFRPVPDTFPGTMLPHAMPPFALPHLIEQAFAALALGAAACLCALGIAHSWPGILEAASLTVLAICVPGMWLAERAADAPRTFAAQSWSLIQRHLEGDEHAAPAFRSADEEPAHTLAGIVAAGIRNLRRLQQRHTALRDAAEAASSKLRRGRNEALHIETLLRSDGAAISEAASGVMAASASLAADNAATHQQAQATHIELESAIERAIGLASATRATTSEITRMAAAAVGASEQAFAAQRSVAALDEKSAALARTTDKIGEALRLAGVLSRSASNPEFATQLRAMAEAADQALFAMQITTAELRVETERARTRLGELSTMIHAQHQLGQALSHAVEQQSEEIAGMIDHLSGACTGVAELRAGVDAITRSGATRMANAEALRGAAGRLPGHADAIAGILRNLPDFAPPSGF